MTDLIRVKKNVILQGAPGVGKTYAAKRLAYSMMGEKNRDRVMMVQFHQSYTYEDFIERFRPSGSGNGFEIKKGSFYNFCKKAADDSENEYMLAYAFRILNEDGYKDVAAEQFHNVTELCAAILLKGVAIQLKRGLGRGYRSEAETLSGIRGKIDITESIKTQTMLRKQMVCSYDEFSVNTYLNRIISFFSSRLFLFINQRKFTAKIPPATKRPARK